MVNSNKWGMVVDIDRCTGCQGCVVACQAENNIPINLEEHFNQRRAIQWIRIERYWEGEYPNVKARFIPIMCQHSKWLCQIPAWKSVGGISLVKNCKF